MAAKPIKKGDVWYIRYDVPRLDGKRRQVWEPCYGLNFRQSEALLHQRQVEIKNGSFVESQDMTIAELFRRFLLLQESQVAPTTLDLIRQNANAHILPKWGTTMTRKLKPAEVSLWYTALGKAGNRITGAGLNPKTIRNIHGDFHRALSEAVVWGVIPNNPLGKVKPPKLIKKQVKTVSPKDIEILCAVLQTHPLRLPFLLILATGMRRGEACGLRWEDINGTWLTIRRSAAIANRQLITKTTKNEKCRTVTLPQEILPELSSYRLMRQSEWVCCREDGSQLSPVYLGRHWKSLMDKLGMDVRLHQLRHTHATMLIMSGMPAKVVQERLGHSDIRMTLNTYTHTPESIQDEAARRVGELWFANQKPPAD